MELREFKGGFMAAATAYRQANPFTPMFGRVPAYMAGREQIIDDMVLAFESADSDPNLCSIFYGARGTGKTALLAYLSYRAQQEGWITANVTASDGMLEDILQRLNESAAHLIEKPASRRVNSVGIASIGSMSWENVDIEFEGANWRTKMNALFAQLEATGTGVLIAVDEVDASFAQMTELVTTYQHCEREQKSSFAYGGAAVSRAGVADGKIDIVSSSCCPAFAGIYFPG